MKVRKEIIPITDNNGDTVADKHERENAEMRKQTLSKKEWVEQHKKMVADIYKTTVPESERFFETDGTILI